MDPDVFSFMGVMATIAAFIPGDRFTESTEQTDTLR
jgi:hypothetical protein